MQPNPFAGLLVVLLVLLVGMKLSPVHLGLARRILRTLWRVARYFLALVPRPPDRGSTSSATRSVRRGGGW